MTDTDTATARPSEPDTCEPRPAASRDWWVRHYTFFGTAVGLVFIWLSMTPSLLPRGPLFQGLVSGAAGAIGYGLGVFGVWLVRYMRSKDTSPPAPRWAWLALRRGRHHRPDRWRSSGSTSGRTTSATTWACRGWASGTTR